MKMTGGPASMNIKLALIIIGATIALGTLYYTQNLVGRLQQREKDIVQLYASSLEYGASTETINADFTFVFQNIIERIDFPLILTDQNDRVNSTGIVSGYKNIEHDPKLPDQKLKIFLQEKVIELSKQHAPILVKSPSGTILQKIYYGDSDIIQRLRFYPYLQILFALVFLIIAYTSFSYVKKSEQRNIWVGMSKETAHQLGTPISSLMGWNEMLKMNYSNHDKVLDISDEISSDLTRLSKITKRFSKIGSKPELIDENPYEIIVNVINYFQRRLPQLGKNVLISIAGEKEQKVKLNIELFEWVIENLIKNALDAIDNKEGKITFKVEHNRNKIEIEVTDNGKGIENNRRKDIFRPGYSTKRRGWGLGLSLSKRIIEDYHNGKIFVKQSIINVGATFKIILNSSEEIT
ncbi:MAG: HAMP domain-containing histidine kinase [Ignavibacteriales bacterium]|jgi:signal transduction histidine kinase|nr:HAMP domain-containing histidine kinase [Ignavibacteriales bacterium]